MDLTIWVKGVVPLVVLMSVVALSWARDNGKWHYRATVGTDLHGGVRMGVKNDRCDNGKNNLTVDWNNDPRDYICMKPPYPSNILKQVEIPEADCKTLLDPPIHKCMSEAIDYSDPIPIAGAHRPLWAKFGEYTYLPKQRWVHNLEHGCAVFLYHPCADPDEIEVFKEIARSCLRKHIVTPLKELSRETPFAVLTYGCKLLLPYVNTFRIEEFLQDHALDAPERHVITDGQFDVGLKRPAGVVSDAYDSVICPPQFEDELLMP